MSNFCKEFFYISCEGIKRGVSQRIKDVKLGQTQKTTQVKMGCFIDSIFAD